MDDDLKKYEFDHDFIEYYLDVEEEIHISHPTAYDGKLQTSMWMMPMNKQRVGQF